MWKADVMFKCVKWMLLKRTAYLHTHEFVHDNIPKTSRVGNFYLVWYYGCSPSNDGEGVWTRRAHCCLVILSYRFWRYTSTCRFDVCIIQIEWHECCCWYMTAHVSFIAYVCFVPVCMYLLHSSWCLHYVSSLLTGDFARVCRVRVFVSLDRCACH